MPGFQIIENTDDAFAAMEGEKKVEEKVKAQQENGGKRKKKVKKSQSKRPKAQVLSSTLVNYLNLLMRYDRARKRTGRMNYEPFHRYLR